MALPTAHPLTILPFYRWTKQVGLFSALVCGSLIPDIVYFFPHRPMFTKQFTHGLWGICVVSTPLAFLLFLSWKHLFRKSSWMLLPRFIQKKMPPQPNIENMSWRKFYLLGYLCCWFGAITHGLWDSFTSWQGAMVQRFPFFTEKTTIVGLELLNYLWIHLFSSLLGSLCCFLFLIKLWISTPNDRSNLDEAPFTAMKKLLFFGMIVLLPIAFATSQASKFPVIKDRLYIFGRSFAYLFGLLFLLFSCWSKLGLKLKKQAH